MKQCLMLPLFVCFVLIGCRPMELEGKVENEKWEPVMNATVKIKRTGNSAISDTKGKVHLSNLHVDDTLVVYAAGYKIYEEPYEWRRGKQIFVLEFQSSLK